MFIGISVVALRPSSGRSFSASYNVTNLLSRKRSSDRFPRDRKTESDSRGFLWLFNFNKFALWIWFQSIEKRSRCLLRCYLEFTSEPYWPDEREAQSSQFIVFRFEIGLRASAETWDEAEWKIWSNKCGGEKSILRGAKSREPNYHSWRQPDENSFQCQQQRVRVSVVAG